MRRFEYSLQARLAPGAARDIGVMVWSDETLDYFAVRGEEQHAQMMNGRIADGRRLGQGIRDFVDYYLERHGGYYYSMARPEEIDAESPRDAASRIGTRWGLDIVVPGASGAGVDPDVVRDLMAATEGGAELRIRGSSFDATDRAFILGFGALGSTVVFAYLPFPYSFSAFSRGRFYVHAVEPVEGGWVMHGKDAGKMELGDLSIEVRPVADPALRGAISKFVAELHDDQRQLVAERLDELTDPMRV